MLPGLASLLAVPALRAEGGEDIVITVGGLFSLTGNWSDLGAQCKRMLEIAKADLEAAYREGNPTGPKLRIELLIEDTALDPSVAAGSAERMIGRGVHFLIGPQSSAEVREVKKVTDRAGVALISPGSTAGSLSLANDTVFRFVADDSLESKAITEIAAMNGIRTILPVWREDAGNQGLVDSLRAFGPAYEVTVEKGRPYSTELTEFAPVVKAVDEDVTELLNKGRRLNEIAVFLGAFDEGAQVLAAAASLRNLGSLQWYAGDGATLSSAYTSNVAAATFASTTNLLAPGLGLPELAQLLRDPVLTGMKASGLSDPLAFAYAAYDGVCCAAQAWLLVNGNRPAFLRMLPAVARNYYGGSGWCFLNQNGDRAVGDFDLFGINLTGGAHWEIKSRHQVTV